MREEQGRARGEGKCGGKERSFPSLTEAPMLLKASEGSLEF